MPVEEKLRDEVIGFQKAKADILLWKLIAIGGVGAAGLGLPTGSTGKESIMAIIPFVAAYCDAIGHDYDLRIALIATFLRRSGPFSEYESFVAQTRSHWSLVGLAAHLGASLIACTLVLLAGFHHGASSCMTGIMLKASAVLGVVLVILVEVEYRRRLAKLAKVQPPENRAGFS